MNPLCKGCHDMVSSLNAWIGSRSSEMSTLVILMGDEPSCSSFVAVFSLDAPTVFDVDGRVTGEFGIHHIPYGLVYDETGTLTRKGSPADHDSLAALLGDSSVPEHALRHVFPQPEHTPGPDRLDALASPLG
jgi:hypothetical protein